jgi:hypothetical protein
MGAVTLEGVLAHLSPAQRERLARIQPARTRAAIESLTKPAPRASTAPVRASDLSHIAQPIPGGLRVSVKGLQLISVANAHEKPMVRHARAKSERAAVARVLAGLPRVEGATRVRIVREGPRLMDTDNLSGAAKSTRDEVAAWLGVDDGPTGPVTWVVDQRKSVGGGYGVEIEITRGAR